MKISFAAGLVLLLLSSSTSLSIAQPNDVVAFTDVSVIPMDEERVLENHTVVVREGRIADMGPDVSVPDGALIVEGRGKYLVPGVAEMHAHIPSPQHGEDTIERTLFLYLSNGVTTIRGMLGHPRHLELRAQAERGEILSPRIYTSGPSLNGNSAQTPEVATKLVQDQHAAGYDLLKLHPGLSRPVFDALVAEAQRLEMPFAGHVSASVGLKPAIAARQASIDHLDGYVEALAGFGDGFSQQASGLFGLGLVEQIDVSRIPELAAATREAGTWNVPTQSLLEHLLSAEPAEQMANRPELRYMPSATVAQWMNAKNNVLADAGGRDRADRYLDVRRRLIKALHDEGAGLLLGSDAPQIFNVPGFSIHHELSALVASGLTPYEALSTGTRNAAEYFGTDEFGIIAEGRSADLMLLEANPLDDIENLKRRAGVMVRGHWLSENEIQSRLDEIEVSLKE